jgi:hypothetical protein
MAINKRIRIELATPDRSSAIWMFADTAALRSWIESGANGLDLALSEDAFSVSVGSSDMVFAEKIGYEVAWSPDGTYKYLNCAALVKSTIVSGKGIIMKAYVGWVDDNLLRFDEYHDDDFVVRFAIDNEHPPSGEDDIDTSGSLADAFAAALKNVDLAVESKSEKSSAD